MEEKDMKLENSESVSKKNVEDGDISLYIIIGAVFVFVFIFTNKYIVGGIKDSLYSSFAKPIIYLYPDEEMEITVKLKNSDRITYSYPVYPKEGWKVLAIPNGELTYLESGRKLYSLYYESNLSNNIKVTDEGFVVEKSEIIPFLEEKLELLGLNEREAEEFIIYWLPILSQNKYNYIRFASMEEIEEYMEVCIDPKPDTFIRITMIFKGLSNPIKVKEQNIITPNRKGFVAVEWGGINLN